MDKRPTPNRLRQSWNYLLVKNLRASIFQVLCFTGCMIQLLSVITEYLGYNTVVEIDIDRNDFTYIPAITISNDFFMFLNQTKIDEEFKDWQNLSTLTKTRKFLLLENLTSSVKFSFLYDQSVLFENCTVYDIYGSTVTKKTIADYERLSEEFRTQIVKKDDFSNVNLSIYEFKPPYTWSRKCKDIADVYLRTEYKDSTGWSDHLWYSTLFYRPVHAIKEDRFKFTKMGNELLLSLSWDLIVDDDLEFGFKIHFHSPDQAPNSNQAATLGINGKAFKWVTLGYTHSNAVFLKRPFKTNCYDYFEYNFESRQDCIDSCKIELARSHCNTLPLYTLMEVEKTANFINKKEYATCFHRFNIALYCEQKCYRKDCSADFYSASILSEVSHARKSFVIDILKPNTGVNQEYNYKQSMQIFELILYLGSTLSLWYGISVYVCVRTGMSYTKKYRKAKKSNVSVRTDLLRRARRVLDGRSIARKSPRVLSNSLLSYQTLNMLSQPTQKTEQLEKRFNTKYKFNYNTNIDRNYRNNLTHYENQKQPIKFIILDQNQNIREK